MPHKGAQDEGGHQDDGERVEHGLRQSKAQGAGMGAAHECTPRLLQSSVVAPRAAGGSQHY